MKQTKPRRPWSTLLVVHSAGLLVGFGLTTWSSNALAQAALVSSDSRILGMGGVAEANVDNAFALYHNPALLALIDRPNIVAGSLITKSRGEAPLLGDFTPSKLSTVGLAGMVGFAYPATPELVLGLGITPVAGSAGKFDTPAGTFEVTAALIEAILGASYKLGRGFSVGAEYRVTYAIFGQEQPNALPTGVVTSKTSLTGLNFIGAGVGVLYQPTETTRLSLSYRSRVVVSTSGDLKDGTGSTTNVESDLSSPDQITIGVSQDLLQKKLRIAAEFLIMLQEALPDSKTTVTPSGAASQTTTTPNRASNVYSGRLGGEYWLVPQLALRAGTLIESSPATDGNVSPFSKVPAPVIAFTGGLGYRIDDLSLDAAFFATTNATKTYNTRPSSGSSAGTYSAGEWTVSLSASFRFGRKK